MQGSFALARTAVRHVLDFALPPRCPGCGSITEAPHRFCFECWSRLTFLGEPCCERCALPFEHDRGEGMECAGCIADPPAFDRMRAAVAYGEVSRQVALRLKYAGRPGVAETVARFLERHVDGPIDALIVPVPLHRWRIWRRGYNQAALIASALARRTGRAALLDLIDRAKATPPLRGMSPRERRRAVRGAFRLSNAARDRVRGRTILLVDDVFTSGATADACARLLRRAGADRIEVLCWARVVRGSDH